MAASRRSRKLGFARERLGFGAHLGEPAAVVGDLGADLGKARFEIGRRAARPRAPPAPRPRAAARLPRIAAVEPRLRLDERRAARGDAAHFAFGGGMAIAGGVGLVLAGRASAAARRVLGVARRGDLGLGRGRGFGAPRQIGARHLQLGLDVGEAVAAGKTPGGPGRRMGGDRKSVPAPQVALRRHQPLARLELAGKPRAVGTRHDADLARAAAPWRPARR